MNWADPGLSPVLFGGYLGLLTLVWGGLAAGIGAWKAQFQLPSAVPAALPRLSVLVPARNEALNIAACVRAVLASDHPDLELVVIDDASTDDTAAHARAAAGGDPRVRVLSGAALPEGWAGKPWACQQAAAAATGTHLLFLDADVTIAPDAARRAAAVLDGQRLDMLSAFGSWKLDSFWERAAIPVIGWFIRGATDIAAVNQPSRAEAFANGQFILVRRAAYTAIGGHEAVRAEVLDDVRLARALKQHAHPIGLYFAPELFSVRLYRSLAEILAGYGKNFYEGMNRKPHVALVALAFLFITVGAPWVALAVAVAAPEVVRNVLGPPALWTGWLALVCALPMALRVRLERLEGRSGALAWTHPLGNLVLALVLVRAMTTVRSTWKGRAFHDGKAVTSADRA